FWRPLEGSAFLGHPVHIEGEPMYLYGSFRLGLKKFRSYTSHNRQRLFPGTPSRCLLAVDATLRGLGLTWGSGIGKKVWGRGAGKTGRGIGQRRKQRSPPSLRTLAVFDPLDYVIRETAIPPLQRQPATPTASSLAQFQPAAIQFAGYENFGTK